MSTLSTPNMGKLFVASSLALMIAACGKTSTSEEVVPDYSSSTRTNEQADQQASIVVTHADEAPITKAEMFRDVHADDYVVNDGDTLWDIAEHYLHNAWYWPEIWYNNPQIDNPHLIYPGDLIRLVYIEGQPRLEVASRLTAGTVRLSPTVREEQLPSPIPIIQTSILRQFLTTPRVMTKEELEKAPYIVASEQQHLVIGAGTKIYGRYLRDDAVAHYEIMRPGKTFIDPDSGLVLGYEAKHIGDARLVKLDDVSTLIVDKTDSEAIVTDLLLPALKNELIEGQFQPTIPSEDIHARVIAMDDAISQVAQYQVIVLNKGARDGLEPGNVLKLSASGRVMRDLKAKSHKEQLVVLPDEESGIGLVYRTFDSVSYALIMKSTRPIRMGDLASTP